MSYTFRKTGFFLQEWLAMDSVSESGNGVDGPARWSLRLFGGFELNTLPGGKPVDLPGKRERILLAYLALSPNCSQPRRKLVTLLWGDSAGEAAPDNLRTCVWRLRKALGDREHRAIVSEGDNILLAAAAFDIDALTFQRLAAKTVTMELERAANLYTGELLDGLEIDSEEFGFWRREEAGRFKDQAIDVLTRLTNRLAESGAIEEAISAGQRVLRVDPLQEPTVRCLMQLYAKSGQRRCAVQLYRTLADALRAELDVEPEGETRALFAEISRGGEARIPALAAPLSVKAEAKGPVGQVHAHRAQPNPPDPAQHLGAAINASQNVAPSRPRRTAWIFAGSLAAMLAIFLLYQFAAPPGTTTARQAGDVDASAISSSAANAISLAVLPFINLSGDPSQDFFSDGMTEEITAALVKIPDLRVVGRTSAYQFKGERPDLRAIGQTLAATHLIEGSVRKDGNRVRITAQLIAADSGVHLWTENYDRELTGVFAIQEDIATAIAAALRMPLGLSAPGARLVVNRNIDPESYAQYLYARRLVRARARGIEQAIRVLEPIVERNPDYAPALALLANAYTLTAAGTTLSNSRAVDKRATMAEFNPKAEAAARRALQLDPNLIDAYISLGRMERQRGKLVAAEDFLLKALELDPNSPDVLLIHNLFLSNAGRRREALLGAEQLVVLEPNFPGALSDLSEILWENEREDAALERMRRNWTGVIPTPAMLLAAQGKYNEAADFLEQRASGIPANASPELKNRAEMGRTAARLLRTAPAKAAAPENLPRLGMMSFVFVHIGAPERAIEYYEEAAERDGLVSGPGGDVGLLWHPSFAPLRKTERFKAYMRQGGYVDYWRARGWPEQCRPIGSDDFECG